MTRIMMVVAAVLLLAPPAGRAAHRSPAPTVAPTFTIHRTQATLRGFCEPERAARRLLWMIDAFNSGRLRAFSRGFTARTSFHPYSEVQRYAMSGRSDIERFARRRHALGDGWTATDLRAPRESGPYESIYSLGLSVKHRGTPVYKTGTKIIIRCATGKVSRWVGPIWEPAL